ncbi:MAG: ABC transporter ATP-binding protein/permease [Mycobacteriaceae bacterium]|nr:ABC transporter ATP-binding protein/permease [Mycobacteriaceae bacterium]MBV9639935.1 ABC transporter ATP-binding protein/permease [Mycobacteriaceae bacterium]
METFTPSLDWGHQLVPTLVWIVKAWAISVVCLLIVLALILRYTRWGRQSWRITGDYFKGRQSLPVWGLFAVLLLSVVMAVRINVLLSYQSNDMLSGAQVAVQGLASGNAAIRDSGKHGFWMSILTFCVIATVHVIRTMVDLYLLQRFIIRWRVWLTGRLTGDWLSDKAYYRSRFIDHTIDNPDQRIQQDIDIFTTGVGSGPNLPSYDTSSPLVFGAVQSVVSVCSFVPILWHLSGPLRMYGMTIPKALFWVVIAYVLVATVVAFWIGHPLIRFNFRNELLNAAFRYALVRLRDGAEAVGFYRGEPAEEVQLSNRFVAIIANYRRWLRRQVGFLGWNLSMSQAINPLPWIVQAPRLFSGAIRLGDVTQSATAFGQIHDSLSYFRNAYDAFAGYRASILRLNGLIDANEKARELPELTTAASRDGSVELVDVEVRTPSGVRLIEPLDLRLEPGESLVITGKSGSGKTTLLRSLAQLWPFASGTLRRPGEDQETMFLSQMPYVPLGDLRAVVSYPASPGEIPDADLQRAMNRVALSHLSHRLNDERDWAKVLSPGEQQRVAFGRILLTKPKAVFLDEATSALDEGLEFALYEMLRSECPDCIVVSVSHRQTVEQHHEHHLQLLGEGAWRLGRVGELPALV